MRAPNSEEEFEARKARAREMAERMGGKVPSPLDDMTWEEFQAKRPRLEALIGRIFTRKDNDNG